MASRVTPIVQDYPPSLGVLPAFPPSEEGAGNILGPSLEYQTTPPNQLYAALPYGMWSCGERREHTGREKSFIEAIPGSHRCPRADCCSKVSSALIPSSPAL